MKHILNNISEEEKNAIREQHTGGMKLNTEKFKKLLETKQGDIKPLVAEQTEGTGTPLVYSQVVEIPNMTKDALYGKIKQWLVSIYKSLNTITDMDDKVSGVWVGKPLMFFNCKTFSMQCSSGNITYVLTIRVKDNKYKIEMDSMEHKAKIGSLGTCSLGMITDKELYKDKGMTAGPYNKVWAQLKEDTKLEFDNLVKSLDTYLKTAKPDDFQP